MVAMASTTTSVSSSKMVERHNIPLPALGRGRSEGFVSRKIMEVSKMMLRKGLIASLSRDLEIFLHQRRF